MADSVDLIEFVMGGGRLLAAAEQENRIDLSSWMDEHEDVNSLLAKLSESGPAVGATVSDSENGDVGSPDVDVEGVDFADGIVPETPAGSESDGESGSGSNSCSSCSSGSSAGEMDSDSDSDISDMGMLSDDVFLPDEKEDSVDGDAVTREVGDPATYSDISDVEDDDGTSGTGSVKNSPLSGGDYSDISSDEDEREYLSPSNNDDSVSPAGPRFDYPDTDGHIGNWLPTVYGASWVHEDPNDCAETDVNCPPPPEGTRAQSVCRLANRPNYFGCVIKNFAADPNFGADSDSEDEGDNGCDGGDGDYDSACNVSVDSGLYSCDDLDVDSQTDYDGDSECDSPVAAAAAATVSMGDGEDDCVVVEVISDTESTPKDKTVKDKIEDGGDVVMELAESGVRRYVLHDSPVSVAPGFGENSKLVCASLGAIGAAEKKLELLRENDDGLRHFINADRDRAANEKPGVDGDTQLELTGPMEMEYKRTIRLGSSHHEFVNTQLILRQYAEKGVPAWFDAMRVTLSASSGERYSISAPQSEWRDFYGYFGDFLDNPLQDLVCVSAPAPKNFGRVFERVKNAKFIFLYTSCDNVGGDDFNLVKFLKCLNGGFMSVDDNPELTFLSHKPVVVVFREQDASYPKCLPMIQFVCHDVLPLPYDGDDPGNKGRGHLCACKVCAAAYTCGQQDKLTLRVEPMRMKRKRDADEEDEDLQEALLASVHPELRDRDAYRDLSSDNDSDSVVVREKSDGTFTYEDRQTNRPPRRRRRVCAGGRRRGRPIRFTRTAETMNPDSTEGASNEIDNVENNNILVCENVPESDSAPVVVGETTDKSDNSDKSDKSDNPNPEDGNGAEDLPHIEARPLRLRRVLGPRR